MSVLSMFFHAYEYGRMRTFFFLRGPAQAQHQWARVGFFRITSKQPAENLYKCMVFLVTIQIRPAKKCENSSHLSKITVNPPNVNVKKENCRWEFFQSLGRETQNDTRKKNTLVCPWIYTSASQKAQISYFFNSDTRISFSTFLLIIGYGGYKL